MTATYKGWYLLDHHKNRTRPEGGVAGDPATKPWYASRRVCQHGYDRPHLVVVHDPETLPDFTPPYDEAERIAKYGASTTRASWHDTIDADSIIPMLPPTYTAWHVRGFNRCGIGLEVGAMSTTWTKAPDAWLTGVITNAAYRVAQHCATFEIDPVLMFIPGRRYASAINPKGTGIVSHHVLDPGRRTDPGFGFPWDTFLERVHGFLAGDQGDDEMKPPDWAREATQWHIDNGIYTEKSVNDVDEDWEFHRQTTFRYRMFTRVILPEIRKAGGGDTGDVALSEVRDLRKKLNDATKG